ncbi:MAG TPA: glycosyltransferase family 39 protein [Candidatus Acidoferrum sp.]|nr:glycosyltransferase family 39 protein [Candidatus Acidoferrum sp.]
MDQQTDVVPSQRAPLDNSVYLIAGLAVFVHFLFNSKYGYFRDELYYAACGEHLAWGYVDHAPLVALASRVSRGLFGDSLFALRMLPALSAAPKVFLGGWMAREVGGARFAQFFAGLLVFLAPIYLTFDNFLSMNAFEPVFWMVCAAIVLRILNGGSPRLWLLFGLVAGIGILNKHSMLFFGSGIAIGLLLTSARKQFARVEIWMALCLAFLIFLPNLLWEIRNGYPTIALLHAVIGTKYSTVSPLTYVGEQFLLVNPLAAPLWLAGLYFVLFDREGRKYSVLGYAYLVVLLEMILLHGKIYYLAPVYIMFLACGAVWWERKIFVRAGAWLKPAVLAPIIVSGIIAAPLAMPILPVAAAVKYCAFFGVREVKVENVPLNSLPQLFGDMFGWQEQVQAMAHAVQSLPAHEQSRMALLAYNYGEAGAIDYFGKRYGLRKAISGHNQYGAWGPRGASGDVVIAIGFAKARLDRAFGDVQAFATISPEYALPEESGLTIYICRQPRQNLAASWEQWKYLD